MIYVTNGATIYIAGTAKVNLSPPTSGTYAGILFFVDRNEPYATHIIAGDSSSLFEGAIYAPGGHVEFAGSNSIAAGCTHIVAATVEVTGGTGHGNDCGGKPLIGIKTDQHVRLV